MQRESHRRGLMETLRVRDIGIVYALVLLVVVLAVVSALSGKPAYLAGDNIANVLDQASLTAILAVFMTVVLVSGNFDLSVGSTAALSAAISLSVVDERGIVVAVVVALAAACVAGLVNGLIVQVVGINAFIVTLGTMTAIRGLVLILTDGRTITASDPSSVDALSSIESGFWNLNVALVLGVVLVAVAALLALRGSRGRGMLALATGGVLLVVLSFVVDAGLRYAKPVYYMAAIAIVTWAVLRFTIVGRRLYATGANEEAARLSGM